MVSQTRSRPSRGPPSGPEVANTSHDLHGAYGSHHAPNNPRLPSLPDARGDEAPPAKKRKLSIRNKQITLDGFVTQTAPSKPPTKISVARPHGLLLETTNGVRSELDADEDDISHPSRPLRTPGRVSPPATALPTAEKQEDKRTLRSQDEGPRLKSELAVYFSNYEEVMFELSKEKDFITVDDAIYVADDGPKAKTEPAKPARGGKGSPVRTRNGPVNGTQAPTMPLRSGPSQFNGSPSLSLDFVSKTLPERPVDPLTDEYYLKSHRRAERKEKQLRNIEKERAMHEKVQLDRLLDGLLGHDWLKVLGITGITDTEAKKYEPKRDYFIAEVRALVDKFKLWKEQEKKQKVDKEAAAAIKDEIDERGESPEGSVEPTSSDLNDSASRQLQQEAVNAMKSTTASRHNKGKEQNSAPITPRRPPPLIHHSPELPITSFYAKRHLRDAALGKARHGRNVTAFGHPIPDMEDAEFELPTEYVTEEALRANARERRRRNRANVVDSSKAA